MMQNETINQIFILHLVLKSVIIHSFYKEESYGY